MGAVWQEIIDGFQKDPDFRMLILLFIAAIGIGGFILGTAVFGW